MIPADLETTYQAIKDRPLDEVVARLAVVQEALSWLGTPYHIGARVKGAGVDCAQLPLAVFEAVGLIPHHEPEPYLPGWNQHRVDDRMIVTADRFFRRLGEDEAPQPGDVALFTSGKCVSHVAISLEWPEVVHAHESAGTIRDNVEQNRALKKRLYGVWSYWGRP